MYISVNSKLDWKDNLATVFEAKLTFKWRGTGGREPGRIEAGGGREAGGD